MSKCDIDLLKMLVTAMATIMTVVSIIQLSSKIFHKESINIVVEESDEFNTTTNGVNNKPDKISFILNVIWSEQFAMLVLGNVLFVWSRKIDVDDKDGDNDV